MARSRKSALSPLVAARRNAIYKGLLGGDRTWLIIGAVVWLPRLVRKAFGKTEQVVALEKLLPGQALTLLAIPQKTRAERRAARGTITG